MVYRLTFPRKRRNICRRLVMARSVLVDAGFVVALLNKRDSQHEWAAIQAANFPPPWNTCESVLSEAFHLLGTNGAPILGTIIRRRGITVVFDFARNTEAVTKLIAKYADVPMSLADACLVRMTETLPDPILLTTDRDFKIYRRYGRQVVPCMTPE